MNKYAKFDPNIPCCPRVLSSFTNWPQPVEIIHSKPSSIKNGFYTCQWLDNVDIHLYAKCDQIMPCEHYIEAQPAFRSFSWLSRC